MQTLVAVHGLWPLFLRQRSLLMKRIRVMTFVGAMALSAVAYGQVRGKTGVGAEQQVADIEAQWLDAVRTNNSSFLEKLLAPEFKEVRSIGDTVTRAQLLERVKDPHRVVDDLYENSVRVRLYGNVALLTSYVTIRGRHGKGIAFSRHFRVIRVLVERNGMWQAVATQATAVKK